jgi:hypothetical protein
MPETTPDPNKPAPTAEERLAALEADNAKLKNDIDVRDRTLKALSDVGIGRERTEEPPVRTTMPVTASPIAGVPLEQYNQWRAKGYTDEQIQTNLRVMTDFLPSQAEPIVRAVGILADRVDSVSTYSELTPEDRGKYKAEVEKTYRARQREGIAVTREQIWKDIVAARMSDPETREKEIQAEVDRRVALELEEKTGRQAVVRSTGALGGAVGRTEKPNANVVGERRSYTEEEFAALPMDQKVKILEDMTF